MGRRKLVILGSTGSIGKSALRVVDERPERFEVEALIAGGDERTLAAQIERYRPARIGLRDEAGAERLARKTGREVAGGEEGILELLRAPGGDILVNAVVGAAGLRPTLEGIGRFRRICLANKESLVAGGEIVMERAGREGTEILPVDSEHVAIHQCLGGTPARGVRRIVLTASGGPFRERSAAELRDVTVEEALRHPTWKMGRKITIDSATLMNKGLELIEAMHLFALPAEKIDVVVHPQSVIHSLVEFDDRSYLAQLGETDMRHPIRYALLWPERPEVPEGFDLSSAGPLTFEEPDPVRFPSLRIAREAAVRGGTAPAILSGANEEAVGAFLAGRVRFTEIPTVIEGALGRVPVVDRPGERDVFAADREARRVAAAAIDAGRRTTC